jgi:hypothetical protein
VQAEVCRFRADDAANPFKRWLASQEVTCAADAEVAFAKGLWNVFARTGDAVSEVMLVDGAKPPDRVTLTLRDATAVAPVFRPGTWGVLYAPRLGTAYPAPGVAPKDEPLWLFVIEKKKPVALLPVTGPQVDATGPAPPTVAGWLEVPENDRALLQTVNGVRSPSVYAGSATADLLPPPERLHGAFFRIANPPAGASELGVSGRGWVPVARRVTSGPGLTVVDAGLPVRAAGSLIVTWSTFQDLAALNQSLGSCKEDEGRAEVEIVVSSCSAMRQGAFGPDPDSCAAFRTEKFGVEEKLGEFTLEDLVPGTYRAELRYGKLPPVSAWQRVAPLQLARINVSPGYNEVYGSLTKGGAPLGEDATIRFPIGVGFVRAEAEQYRAVLRREPLGKDAQIEVVACDGDPRATVLTDEPLRRVTRFDIDIPDNSLTITVVDTFTREPLGDARIKMDVLSIDMPRRPVLTRNLSVDDRGRVEVEFIPVRELLIAVSASGYQRKTIPPFSLTKSEKRELDVQLVPLRGTRGRVVSSRPFEGAFAYWYSSAGRQTEQAEIGPDGTFVYSGVHGPDETLTIVSLSHPLWVTPSPNANHRDSITIRFPDTAPVRTFDVTSAETDRSVSRFVGLIIGGLRVPLPLVGQHQVQRRQAGVLRGPGPMHLVEVAEAGPIDVLLGPATAEVGSPAAAIDLFALEQFADPPRIRLAPGATAVTFDSP